MRGVRQCMDAAPAYGYIEVSVFWFFVQCPSRYKGAQISTSLIVCIEVAPQPQGLGFRSDCRVDKHVPVRAWARTCVRLCVRACTYAGTPYARHCRNCMCGLAWVLAQIHMSVQAATSPCTWTIMRGRARACMRVCARAPRHHGTMAPWHHGTKAPRHHGTTAPRHKSSTAPPHHHRTTAPHHHTTAPQREKHDRSSCSHGDCQDGGKEGLT